MSINALAEVEIVKLVDDMITKVIHDHNKYKEEYYVSAQEFMGLLRVRRTTFYKWKAEGKLERAIYSPSRGSKRPLFHRFFNVFTQRIELPELKRLPVAHRKRSRGKGTADGNGVNGGAADQAARQANDLTTEPGETARLAESFSEGEQT